MILYSKVKSFFIKLFILLTFASTFTLIFCACTNKKNAIASSVSKLEQDTSLSEIKTVPQRIISLSPAQTEILCAVGAFDQLVARSQFCDFPPQVLALPVAGGFDGKSISLETLLSYKPDLVFLASGMHDFLLEPLKNQGIKVFISKADSVNSILNEIKEIANLTGHKEQGEILANQIKEELLQLMKNNSKTSANPISVYWEVWNSPYMSIGSQSFINELIIIAGGTNIFSKINQPYPVVSEESIIQSNPQVIIVPKTMETNISSIKNRTGWKNILAVKENKIYALDQDLISRPGPRIAQAAQQISNILYNHE